MNRGIDYFGLFLRIFLGCVFAYSGYTKLMEPIAQTEAAIVQYEVIPYVFVPWIARIFPWIEMILGCFLLLGYAVRLSALGVSGLSTGFIGLILLNYMMTGKMLEDCGCFGEGSFIHFSAAQILVVDLISLIFALFLVLRKKHILSLDGILLKN
ncbi:MAG: DoxX family protein [Candidatus Omnitrophica bacterium]|nr:DoxX family protein [Candidatus Omnitrophota bacterium]